MGQQLIDLSPRMRLPGNMADMLQIRLGTARPVAGHKYGGLQAGANDAPQTNATSRGEGGTANSNMFLDPFRMRNPEFAPRTCVVCSGTSIHCNMPRMLSLRVPDNQTTLDGRHTARIAGICVFSTVAQRFNLGSLASPSMGGLT